MLLKLTLSWCYSGHTTSVFRLPHRGLGTDVGGAKRIGSRLRPYTVTIMGEFERRLFLGSPTLHRVFDKQWGDNVFPPPVSTFKMLNYLRKRTQYLWDAARNICGTQVRKRAWILCCTAPRHINADKCMVRIIPFKNNYIYKCSINTCMQFPVWLRLQRLY